MLSAYSLNLLFMGRIISYFGEIQNGSLPPVFSRIIAMNLSIDPRTALWTMTGL